MDELLFGGVLNEDQVVKGSYQWEKRIRKVVHKTRDLSNKLKSLSTGKEVKIKSDSHPKQQRIDKADAPATSKPQDHTAEVVTTSQVAQQG